MDDIWKQLTAKAIAERDRPILSLFEGESGRFEA